MLGYNKLRELSGLNLAMGSMMQDITNLQWIDVSHNYLTTLDYNFEHFPKLKTLYIHCNFIVDLAELEKLKPLLELKSINIHGNPFAAIPNFRILAISILPDLKKMDSVLISKKERDNAIFIRSQTKKYPLPKNPAKPPQEKSEEEEK